MMKKKFSLTFFCAGCILFLATACKSKIPPHVIPPEQMKSLLFDVMVAEQIKVADTSSVTRTHLRDSTTYAIRRVLAIHHIDKEKYFKSLDFYEANPDILKKLVDSTKAYGQALEDSLHKKKTVVRPVIRKDTLSKGSDSSGRHHPGDSASSVIRRDTVSPKKR